MSAFPDNVWDGSSKTRRPRPTQAVREIYAEPDGSDWDRIVDELIAVQVYTLGLGTGGGFISGVADVPGLVSALGAKSPVTSPTFTDIVTHNTTVGHGYTQILHNTGTVLPTTIPFGESFEGYNFNDIIDNAFMRGFLQHLQATGYPAFWEQWENYWQTNNSLEYYTQYISIDKSITYRPWGSALELSTHALDYFMQFLTTWVLRGIGSGYGDADPPVLLWDGTTGALAAGAFSGTSFSGDGSALTGLAASNLGSGTIPDARFPGFMTVDNTNGRLAINTTNFFDTPSGVDCIFRVTNVAKTKSFGWTGDRIALDNGTNKALFTTGAVGSFSNSSFIIVTNSTPAGTFGTNGSLTVAGAVTTTGLVVSGTSFQVNTAGTYKITIGSSLSDSFPTIHATPDAPTLSNYLMLVDGPGGGVVLTQSNYAILQAGSNQFHITPTGFKFGGGTVFKKLLSATATLNFTGTTAQSSADLTVSVTGAAIGDSVIVSPPAGVDANACYTGSVTAADTVTVRFNNYGATPTDPASGLYRVTVITF